VESRDVAKHHDAAPERALQYTPDERVANERTQRRDKTSTRVDPRRHHAR
jgi:hypothetical protein